ncbi:hypothetical protein GQ53DRAFT_682232 [Thozetella sp. PMI_491]|nr:hypothetical protein GQ53DRAFT_682232 [Thozetella sp. PMI_491]
MSNQPEPEQGTSKRQKQLACQRCRRRKQKCTETRPCENCTQSGSECIPFETAALKPGPQHDYVQRLEERVAELESLLPQESLDHITAAGRRSSRSLPPTQPLPALGPPIPPPGSVPVAGPILASGSISRFGAQVQTVSQPPIVAPFMSSEQDHPAFPDHLEDSPAEYQTVHLRSPTPLANAPIDVLSPALLGAVAGIYSSANPRAQDDAAIEEPDLDLELERFLIHTFFEMAHSQYPILLKHEFLQWAESWRSGADALSNTTMWRGFFIYMVYAIAFLMTKSRINGPARSQAFFTLATSRYLPCLMMTPSPLVRAQGLLLLTVYALHMPSQETIITLSSCVSRFCVMSQLHLAETEPPPVNIEAFIQIQLRRRVFWCAYAIDRAVCSSYDLPVSISDNHITVQIFDNIDDDQLLTVASSAQRGSRFAGSDSATSISSALYTFVGRQIESEIQETVLGKNFVENAEETFTWRAKILEKLKRWNGQFTISTESSHRGYASSRWLKMIYYYNIIMLYRPSRIISSGIAGDLSVQACCQALLLFRRFQMAREIAQPWLGLLTQFQIGVTLLYCFFATPPLQWKPSYKSADVPDAIRACSSTLAILAERWAETECIRDIFEILAREIPLGETWGRPQRISLDGTAVIQENWERMRKIVLHRPTLRMIHEMAHEQFTESAEISTRMEVYPAPTDAAESTMAIFEGIDLQWVDPPGQPPLTLGPRFGIESDAGAFADEGRFQL